MAESVVVQNQSRLGDTCRGFGIGFVVGAIVGVIAVILFQSQF